MRSEIKVLSSTSNKRFQEKIPYPHLWSYFQSHKEKNHIAKPKLDQLEYIAETHWERIIKIETLSHFYYINR